MRSALAGLPKDTCQSEPTALDMALATFLQ